MEARFAPLPCRLVGVPFPQSLSPSQLYHLFRPSCCPRWCWRGTLPPSCAQDWKRRSSLRTRSEAEPVYLAPREDLHAPDLYIPLVAFFTFIVMVRAGSPPSASPARVPRDTWAAIRQQWVLSLKHTVRAKRERGRGKRTRKQGSSGPVRSGLHQLVARGAGKDSSSWRPHR